MLIVALPACGKQAGTDSSADKAKQEVQSIQYAKIRNAAVSIKNEVLEMIAKVRERKGRLDLPIVSGKHLRKNIVYGKNLRIGKLSLSK